MAKITPFELKNPTPPVNIIQEELVMVKLTRQDLEMITEILQLVCDYKVTALRPQSWQRFQQDYLPSIVDQIGRNEFKCNRADENTFQWLLDQICHSRQLIPGVPHNQGRSLIDIPLGQRVADICRQASQGQRSYDQWRRRTEFSKFFEDQ